MVGVATFPDKDRESKTWQLEQDGPGTDVETLLARCAYFSPLAEVVTAGQLDATWRPPPWRGYPLTNWITSRRRTAHLAVQHCTGLLYTCQDCHQRLCHPHWVRKQ